MSRIYLAILLIAFFSASALFVYHGCKASWEAEQKVKAYEEIQKQTGEVTREQEKRKEAVEKMDPAALLKYWHGVQQPDPGGGKAAPPGQAKSSQP